MSFKYSKTPSVVVAWLNIILAFPVSAYVLMWLTGNLSDSPSNSSDDYDESKEYNTTSTEVEESEHFELQPENIIMFCAVFIPWILASIFLLKGIKQNRLKYISAWIHLAYLYLLISFSFFSYVFFMTASYTDEILDTLYESIPIFFGWIVVLVSIIPVKKLHDKIQESLTVEVVTTPVVVVQQKPETERRYMPIFEDY